jgi:hypothetical protein
MGDMRFWRTTLILILAALFIPACGGDTPATPKETLTAYTIAVKKKDVAMMKLLLSAGSLKLHEQEAKARNVSLDEIILRDTFFPVPEGKKFFPYKNEKIEGEIATVEIKNNFDTWDKIYLVKENGIWKIDKKGTSDQILNQAEEDQKKLDELINQGKDNPDDTTDPITDGTPDSNQTPTNPNAPLPDSPGSPPPPVPTPNNDPNVPNSPNNPDFPSDNQGNPKSQPRG